MLTAAELHRRGQEASNAGKFATARKLLGQALQRDAAGDTRARVLLTLAMVDAEVGGLDDGLALCDQALSLDGLSDSVQGLAWSQRALLLMRSGSGSAAVEAFAQAEPLLLGEPEPLMRVHLNRGNVYLQRGEAGRSASEFERAAHFADVAGLPVQRAKIEHNLGYSRLLQGDLVTSLRMMDAAAAILDDLSEYMRAVGRVDRAEVLIAAGMKDRATADLREAATAFGHRRARQSQAEAELVLSRILLREDASEAGRVARRSRQRFLRRGSDAWALRAEAVELTGQIEAGGVSHRLLERAVGVVASLETHGLHGEAETLDLQVARLLSRRGQDDDAAAVLAGRPTGANSRLSTRLLRREVAAELAEVQGSAATAFGHISSGLAELHDWQSSFGSLDLQSSLVGHGRGLAVHGLRLALEDGRLEVVFEWSERARALASRVTPLRPPADGDAAAELAQLRSLQGKIAADDAGPDDVLRREASSLRERIRERRWFDPGSGLVVEPVALDDVTVAVSAAAGVLVSYIVVDAQVHALCTSAAGTEVCALGSMTAVRSLVDGLQADLDMASTHLPAAIRATVVAGLEQRLQALAELLVVPLAALASSSPVAVVPSGALAGVPWPLLPGLKGRPLTVPRSASSWLTSLAAPAAAAATAGFVAGPRVARAVEEVSQAAAAWSGARVLTGDAAHADAVAELAARVDVFHVAAHGRHSADNPLFSGLELVDGPWFGYDIDQLGEIPSTVVLSACELGRSSVRWGEETIGMTVAWLHAGARCVIASPASVDDDVACSVLAAAHAHLAEGQPPSVALAAATEQVGGGLPAPFVCFGNGW